MSFEVDQPAKPLWTGHRFTVMGGSFVYDDGKTVVREWIDPGNVVAVLPYDDQHFYLGFQPREVTGLYQLGLCAGKIDPGEDELTAAQRELGEEFGFRASLWLDQGEFYSSEGITSEKCRLYLATDLYGSAEIDVDERVDVLKFPFSALESAIDRVTNAKAKIALLTLWKFRATLV